MRAVLAGPTAAEEQAGFAGTTGEADLPFQAKQVGDVAVIDFVEGGPAVFLQYPSGIGSLVSTVGSLRGVRGVSVLVRGVPLCQTEGATCAG